MAAIDSPLLPQIPPSLLRSLVRDALEDAQNVIRLLEALGIHPRAEGVTLFLPAEFLLGLGAWARLFRWERLGITLHRDSGIGSADEVLRRVFLQLAQKQEDESAFGPSLWNRLIHFTARRLACTGQELLGAEVTLQENQSDDEALLDALAHFIWQNRHHGRHIET
ncbi:MAG: hypothetical protein JWN43_3702 [Gammaproteobacteria bacterium]|nr:hypothetical protein [Gammaproteobacteria bacterium]